MAIYFWDKSPVSRVEILHSADAIAFVVPAENELDANLDKLIELGLVEKKDDCFALTDPGMALAQSCDAGPHNLNDTLASLETHFSSRSAA